MRNFIIIPILLVMLYGFYGGMLYLWATPGAAKAFFWADTSSGFWGDLLASMVWWAFLWVCLQGAKKFARVLIEDLR